MNFVKTLNLLTAQAEHTAIPLESVMELMRTYLTEVRHHTGVSVEKCKIGDMDQLITSLAAVTSEINFVFRRNEQDILGGESQYAQSLTRAQEKSSQYEKRINDLQESIRTLNNEQSRNRELLQKMGDLDADRSRLQQEVDALEAKLQVLKAEDPDSEAGKLRAKIEQQQAMVDQLTRERAEAEKTNTALGEKIKDLNAELEAEREDMRRLTFRADELEQEHRRNTEQIFLLDAQINKCVEVNRELTNSAGLKNAELTTLQRGKAELIERNEKLSGQIQPLKEEFEALQKANNALVAEHSNAETKNTQLAQKNLDLEQENRQLQEELTCKESEIKAVQERLLRAKNEAGEMLRQLVELEMTLKSQTEDNENFREKHVDQIRKELEEQRVKRDQAEAESRQLRKEQEELESKRKMMSEQTMLQRMKTDSANKLLRQEQQKLEAQQKVVSALEEDLRVKARECTALLDREKELRDLLDEDNMALVKDEISANIQKLEETIKQAAADRTEAMRIRVELKQKRDELDACTEELQRCRNVNQKLCQEYDQIRQQLDEVSTPEKLQHYEQLRNEIELMQVILNRLFDGSIKHCGGEISVSDDLMSSLAQAENTVREVRTAVREYLAQRQKALEIPE